MDKKNMSVAEIIAALRKLDGGKGGAAEAPAPAPKAPPAAERPAAKPAAPKAAADKPAAKPAAAGGARPSVQEMLAMARAEKEKAAAAPAAEKAAPAAPAAKPAPKPVAAKAKPAEPEVPAGPKDTSSILSAASETKPGPMSKAEAAAKAPAKPAAKEAPRRPVPPMPVKPDYAKPKAPAAKEVLPRRAMMLTMVGILTGTFFALGCTSLALATGLFGLGTVRFLFPNFLVEPPSKFKVGAPAAFAPGQVETKYVAQYGVWVVNGEYNGQAQIYALRTVCTHLGCTPNWLEAEQKFKCPCHGSGFYKDGINFEGPAPRPLERFGIRLAEDGQLEVDKSKLFLEDQGQWTDPNCYYVA